MRKMQHKVVRVDWLDAFGGVLQGWKDAATLARGLPVHAVTFGVLLSKDKHRVVVCPHLVGDTKGIDLSEDTVAGDGAINIPIEWVQKITIIGLL